MEKTAYVAEISYEIEDINIENINIKEEKDKKIKETIEDRKNYYVFNPDLEYLDSKYDQKTGTTGVAFTKQQNT